MPRCGHVFYSPKDTAEFSLKCVEKAVTLWGESSDDLVKRAEDAHRFAIAHAPLWWQLEGGARLTDLVAKHRPKFVRRRQESVEFVRAILDPLRLQEAAESQVTGTWSAPGVEDDQQMAAGPTDATASSQMEGQGTDPWNFVTEATSLDESMA